MKGGVIGALSGAAMGMAGTSAAGGGSGSAALGIIGAGAALGTAARRIPPYENTWLFR